MISKDDRCFFESILRDSDSTDEGWNESESEYMKGLPNLDVSGMRFKFESSSADSAMAFEEQGPEPSGTF